MENEEIKNSEVLLKSYLVIIKTLDIRLKVIRETLPLNNLMEKAIINKLSYYQSRIALTKSRLEDLRIIKQVPAKI
ncbi:MAG TPA: hypothetical protein VD908_04475 [Cytophagales bacterium]|nr:hypothetical protein [Cytophagales bacterium]